MLPLTLDPKRSASEQNRTYSDCKPDPVTGEAFFVLARHEERRQQLPTISTLVGPTRLAVRAWRKWSSSQRRIAIFVVASEAYSVVDRWVDSVFTECDLIQNSVSFIAAKLGLPLTQVADRFQGKTSHEVAVFFENARLQDIEDRTLQLAKWILESRATGSPLEPAGCREWLASQGGNWDRHERMIDALLPLLPAGTSPTVLVTLPESDRELAVSSLEELNGAAWHLVNILKNAPSWTVGFAISKEDWECYEKFSPESYAKALLRENLVPLRALSFEEMRTYVQDRVGSDASALDPVLMQLAAEGADQELIDCLVEADLESRCPKPYPPADDHAELPFQSVAGFESKNGPKNCRSKQEQFLFELLEGSPNLAGLFALNVKADFPFGNRPAELDLACPSLRIAIEVDGHYHFTDLDSYRRDRRKDFALQRHGYLVLRFLAQDIVPDMQLVRDTIGEAVEHRKNSRTQLMDGEKQ